MKIFVTGGSGMVGRNIVEFLNGKGLNILYPTSDEVNLLNKKDVKNYILRNKPEMIIHCAGKVGGIQANINNPVRFLYENTQMGLNILMSSYESGIKKFMNVSSSCMYPRNIKNPLNEDSILSGELEPTNEGYALSKIITTRFCEYLKRENNSFHYKTIIPCNLYGKYDSFDLINSHMIPSVLRKMHEAKINNQTNITMWGNGKARREFMYVGDLSNFVYYAINNFDKMPQNINIGLGLDYSIKDYYKIIADVTGYKGKIKNDLSKPVGIEQKLINNTKLIEFGWKHKTSLKDGIQKTYNYYLNDI